MGAKESDRTLMTVESNIGGRGDSIAEAFDVWSQQAVQTLDNALFQTLIKSKILIQMVTFS